MSKTYSGEGNVISYTAAATHSSGDAIAIGGLLGVCLSDAVSGDVIAVQLDGVFALPKVDAAVIGLGETITWDVSADEADDAAATPATGDLTLGCVAMEAKGATTSETILVKLNVAVNTVT